MTAAAKPFYRSRATSAAKLIDLMKATRLEWLSLADVKAVSGMSENSARGWLIEMVSQGVLLRRKGPRGALLYTLAAVWGGTATHTAEVQA